MVSVDVLKRDQWEEENAVFAINPMGLPLKELRRLKDQFQDEEGQPVKLDEQKFVDALLSRLSSAGTSQNERQRWDSELRTLFKKIDAGCSETVTWEEFTNYMLFHVPGFNSGDGACELSHNAAAAEALAGAWQCGHADMINNIAVVPDLGTGAGGAGGSSGSGSRRYITAGRDGFVKVWHPNLTLHKAIDVGNTTSWLSACCWMQKSRKLAVASSSFRIFFYDSSFSQITHIDHKDGTPLCLGYTETHENKSPEKEILMVGDDKGYVTVFPLDAADWDQEPKPDGKPEGKPGDEGLKIKKASRVKYHKDWVTKVGFVSQLQAMVTCGLDGEINICDVHTNQRKEGRDAVRLHKKGVHSWCWCKSYKFFASGGSDRQIIIWNPYTQKAMNYLQGHNAPVLDVLVNEAQHQLISMSVDKVVKVWDILNYQCIQTFTDKTEYKPEDRLTCMAFDEEGPALVLCSSLINVLPVSVKVETSRTHLAPIVGALHNDVFHQIISGDNMGTISVWDIQTGKLEFEFRRAHQDHKMTCMAFDRSKRCLYTGGEEGAVKLWNFSSGQQLRTFTMKQPAEIRSLLWAKEGPNSFVVGLAWDRRIYVWPDSRKQIVEPQYVLEDFTGQGHTDDVTCLSRLSSVSGLLATGGDDGYVCFWKIQETSAGHGASSRRYRLCDTSQAPSHGVASTEGSGDRVRKGKKGSEVHTTGNKRVSHTTQPQGYPDSPSSLTAEGHSSGWPEDLSGLEADTGLASFGVERTVFLEHKACLLTIHADGSPRLWSTKQAEFLGKLDFMASPDEVMEDKMEVITSIYADDDNTWLFTGHADGWVRIWDLTMVTAKPDMKKGLLLFKEMHLHQMAVTSLQHFEISGKVVIVSASSDWTVAMHTMDGARIGNFSHRGPQWRLSDQTTWCDQPPPSTEEGIRGPEDDDRWGISPRRTAGGPGGHRDGATTKGTVPGIGIGVGMRTPRASKVRTRPVIPAPVHSGQGDFGKLSVVERFKPDLTLAEQERQRLQKFAVSEHTHRSGKVWSRR